MIDMGEVNRAARRLAQLHDAMAAMEAELEQTTALLRSLNTGGHWAVQFTLGDHENRINKLETER